MSLQANVQKWAEDCLNQELKNRAVGWQFILSQEGGVRVSMFAGWARAPWETTAPSVPMSATRRTHVASIGKIITASAVLKVIEDWNTVLADAAQEVPRTAPGTAISFPKWLRLQRPGDLAKLRDAVAARTGYSRRFVERAFTIPEGIGVDTPYLALMRHKFPESFNFGNGVELVTLRQMLTHTSRLDTSGVPLEVPWTAAVEWNDQWDLQAVLESVFKRDLVATPPGTYPAKYEGDPLTLLRYFVDEHTAGYEAYTIRKVFTPLGFGDQASCKNDPPGTDTLYYPDNVIDANGRAIPGDAHPPSYTNTAGSGGWYISPNAIIGWLSGILRGDVHPAHLALELLDPTEPLGFWAEGRFLEKNGGSQPNVAGGTNCSMVILPDHRVTAVLMVNTAGVDATRVMLKVLDGIYPALRVNQERFVTPVVRAGLPWQIPAEVLRVTTDGTDPLPTSDVYSWRQPPSPLSSTVIRMSVSDDANRIFLGPTERFVTFDPNDLRPADAPSPANAGTGLRYAYYQGQLGLVPNTRRHKPKSSGTGARPDLQTPPPAQNADFAFVYEGFIHAAAASVYVFELTSKDGSRLWIGDILLIDNDGVHDALTLHRGIALARGKHRIRISFFVRGAGASLALRWQTPSAAMVAVPAAVLYDA